MKVYLALFWGQINLFEGENSYFVPEIASFGRDNKQIYLDCVDSGDVMQENVPILCFMHLNTRI